MGTFFGVLVGFVLGLVLAGAAFIDIVSTDNERGYQPNKPLDGPPPNVRAVCSILFGRRETGRA